MTDSQPDDILPEWSQQQILNFNNDDNSIYSDPFAFVNISSVDWDFVDSNLLPIDSTIFDDSDELLFGKTSQTSSTNQNETLDCQLFTDLPFDSILDQIFLESPKISDSDNDQAIQNIYDHLKADVTPITDHRPEPQSVIDAIFVNEVPTMSWICQPPANHRFRYSTDGIRYLESSRLNPPAVELPNLSHIHLAADQSFAVQLALVTTEDNPGGKCYLHEYELLYNGDDAIQVDSALVRLPLTDKDISSRIKKFRKIRIIKKKHLQYKYQLIPHDPLVPGNEPEEYVQPTGRRMTKPKQAKLFDKLYHTDQCRIICQLMFRDGENWYTTELFCQTGIITNGGTADDE